MATDEQIASLYANLGLRVDTSQWSKGGQAISGLQGKIAGLEGALASFSNGRFRKGNGQFFSTQARSAHGLEGAVKGVGREARAAQDQLGGLWQVAAGYAAYAGIDHAKHALIGFNAEVQDAKISLSAMLSGQLGQDWKTAENNATALYNEFQRFSTLTPVTTQQILEFGKSIAAATFQAGGGVEELKQLTEQGVIAGKVLAGDRGAGYVELEMTEMLSGIVNKRMIFARQLLGMGHVGEEEFKALSGKQRIATLQKILNSEAMQNARDAYGKSYTGVTSTAWDRMQIALGQTGKPLFDEITAKVQKLNEWMEKNKTTIEAYAKSIGSKLVTAFDLLLAAIGFVTDHATYFEGVLIGLSTAITAFAIKSAISWAIAFWPITLGVAAIATLYVAYEELDGIIAAVGEGFTLVGGAVWGTIKALGRGAADFFGSIGSRVASIGRAIKNVFASIGGVFRDIADGVRDAWHSTANFISDRIDDLMIRLRKLAYFVQHPVDALLGNAPDFDLDAIDTVVTAAPTRPTSTLRRSEAPSVTVRPQVNVQVTGNMPEGWIETKINTAIDDHHEQTWSNVDSALTTGDDE